MVLMLGQRAAASAQRIYEVLDEPPTVVDRPGAVDLDECRGDVRFDHVSFDYASGTMVLDGFDLHLRPGETVALVGRTGTGKSTAARLLARFYDVTGGAVRIDGRDVRDITLPSLRHHIGMVLDEPFLFSVSIRDNIAYGRPDATLDEVVAAARAAGADDFIREMSDGYDTVVGERGFTLSGGQRQRIAIARTLVVNPPILVLDDATSAIDVQVEQQIHDALSVLMQGRTTLIIAHRLSTISLADRVAVVEDGRIIAEGTHLELMASEPRYSEILAQTEEDARRRIEERDGGAHGVRADGRPDARAGRSTTTSSAAATSTADVGELADLDAELVPHGGARLMACGGGGMVGPAAAAVSAAPAGTRAAACPSRASPRRCSSVSRRSSREEPVRPAPDNVFSHRMADTGVSLGQHAPAARRTARGHAGPRRDRGHHDPGRSAARRDRHRPGHPGQATGASCWPSRSPRSCA